MWAVREETDGLLRLAVQAGCSFVRIGAQACLMACQLETTQGECAQGTTEGRADKCVCAHCRRVYA